MLTALIARLFPPSNAVTEGPSPKVTVPAAILVVAGVALVLAGAFGAGTSELVGYGLAIIAASGVVGVAGGAASPGSVVVGKPVIGTPSDATLSPAAQAAINAEPEDGQDGKEVVPDK